MNEAEARNAVKAFLIAKAEDAVLELDELGPMLSAAYIGPARQWMERHGSRAALEQVLGMPPAIVCAAATAWRANTIARLTIFVCTQLPADQRTLCAINDLLEAAPAGAGQDFIRH